MAAAVTNLNKCDPHSIFFGYMGITAAQVFSNLGSAYGTAKSGVGLSSMSVMRPDLMMRNVIPVVMAGILGIYGLIIGIIMNQSIGDARGYPQAKAYAHLAAGLTVGLSALAAGLAIGIVGDAGVRAVGQQPRVFVGMVLMLIFGEALALYGKKQDLFSIGWPGLIIGLVIALVSVQDACMPYTDAGSAYGTAKTGMAISNTGVMRPDLVMRNIIPVVMAGILGIYGLIMGIIISQAMGDPRRYSLPVAFAHLSGGVTVGLSALAAGFTIGVAGEAGIRGTAQQPRVFVGMILMMIFSEALALYGLIIGLVISLVRVEDACVPWS